MNAVRHETYQGEQLHGDRVCLLEMLGQRVQADLQGVLRIDLAEILKEAGLFEHFEEHLIEFKQRSVLKEWSQKRD